MQAVRLPMLCIPPTGPLQFPATAAEIQRSVKAAQGGPNIETTSAAITGLPRALPESRTCSPVILNHKYSFGSILIRHEKFVNRWGPHGTV